MATQKSTPRAPADAVTHSTPLVVPSIDEAACENLFWEIAERARRTREILQNVDFGDHGETIEQIGMLENTIYQMGWLADVALTNMGSVMRIHDGNAVKWMAAPSTISALGMESQHG